MRVAITHTRYTATGGVERYTWDLVRRLVQAGHEVHYFCHFWDDQIDPRVQIHRIPNFWKQIRFMKVWNFDHWLRKRVLSKDFDIVHGFSKSSNQDIYTDGSGCLLDYQKYSIDRVARGRISRALRRASLHQKQMLAIEKRRFTRGNFHRVVAMSDLAADQIKRRYGLGDDELITIYNGIDTERFSPDERESRSAGLRDLVAVSNEAFVVLCVANDYRRKGVPTLIEAARIIKERGGLPNGRALRIAVVGKDRPHRERALAALSVERRVDDVVKFYGPQEQIERWHALADLLVLPSHFDAFGNVVLEALASGVPALVSSKAGAAEVVEEKHTGWILDDPEDAAGIAARILELAGDGEKRVRMGIAARESAKNHSWDHHFSRIYEVYEEVYEIKKRSGVR